MELSKDQKESIIKERYDAKSVEHLDINKIIELITRDFMWPKMRQDIIIYIQNCDTYIKVKHSRHRLYNKLQSPVILKEV